MTVVVKYDEKGNPQYRSAKGIGSTEEDRIKANQLDLLLKNNINKLKKKLDTKRIVNKEGKGNVSAYWELGYVLRQVIESKAEDGNSLLDKSEKYLFWLNVAIHTPEYLKAKDRGPNRNHLEYCFRLAGNPKETSEKLNWGEWVYLYDSPTINKEERFDIWFKSKIKLEPKYMTRENIRVFVKCANAIFNKLETKDLTDKELVQCYDGAWVLSKSILKKHLADDPNLIPEIQNKIITNARSFIGHLMKASISPEEFATNILTDSKKE